MTEYEPDWGYEEMAAEGQRHRDQVHGGGECHCIVPGPGPVTGPAGPGEAPF